MAKLTERDIHLALESVIASDDEVIVLFSGIYTFAHRFGWPVEQSPSRILAVIEEHIGSNRTLLIPTYSFSFCSAKVFDLERTETDIGAIPNAAIGRLGYFRTSQPINSYSVRGPRTEEIMSLPCTTAWGEDGALGWMEKVNAKICILGVPWGEACSLFHYAEEVCSVPYRYFKRFAGKLFRNGEYIRECHEVIYARSIKVPPKIDFQSVYPQLSKAGVIQKSTHDFIPLESAKAKDIVKITCEILEADPYAYVVNDNEVKNWVRTERSDEIALLLPGEVWP